jgi:hypothetical protein
MLINLDLKPKEGNMPRWVSEAQAKQAAIIKQHQPWTKSTGAKTIEGSRRSTANGGFGCDRYDKIMAEVEAERGGSSTLAKHHLYKHFWWWKKPE